MGMQSTEQLSWEARFSQNFLLGFDRSDASEGTEEERWLALFKDYPFGDAFFSGSIRTHLDSVYKVVNEANFSAWVQQFFQLAQRQFIDAETGLLSEAALALIPQEIRESCFEGARFKDDDQLVSRSRRFADVFVRALASESYVPFVFPALKAGGCVVHVPHARSIFNEQLEALQLTQEFQASFRSERFIQGLDVKAINDSSENHWWRLFDSSPLLLGQLPKELQDHVTLEMVDRAVSTGERAYKVWISQFSALLRKYFIDSSTNRLNAAALALIPAPIRERYFEGPSLKSITLPNGSTQLCAQRVTEQFTRDFLIAIIAGVSISCLGEQLGAHNPARYCGGDGGKLISKMEKQIPEIVHQQTDFGKLLDRVIAAFFNAVIQMKQSLRHSSSTFFGQRRALAASQPVAAPAPKG